LISNPTRVFDSNTLWNFNEGNTSILADAANAAMSGVANVNMAFVGNSTVAGRGAGTGVGLTAGARALSFPSALQDYLGLGIPAQASSFFGSANYGDPLPNLYDPRLGVASGAGWAESIGSVGGAMWLNSTTTDPFPFSPGVQANEAKVYYQIAPGFDTFTLDVGGATTPIDANNTAAFGTATYNFTLSTPTITVRRTNVGTNTRIIGMDAYNNAVKSARLWNMGWGGSTTTTWAVTTNPTSPSSALAALPIHGGFIDLGINDRDGAVAITAFISQLVTIVNAIRTNGNAILVIPVPSSTASTSLAVQLAYDEAIYYVATLLNVPVISLRALYGSFAAADAIGYYGDTTHPSALGYAAIAILFGQAVRYAMRINGYAVAG